MGTLFFQPLFWQQQNYYGIDLTALHGTAFHGYFSQVNICLCVCVLPTHVQVTNIMKSPAICFRIEFRITNICDFLCMDHFITF